MATVSETILHRLGDPSSSVAFREGRTTRVATWDDVSAVAQAWRASGLDGPVGLVLGSPIDMAANLVGALAAGFTVAPLDPSAPPADVLRRVRDLGLRALVTGAEGPEVQAPGLEMWRYDSGELAYRGGGGPGRRPAGRSVGGGLMMSSSGTTGPVKVVTLDESQLLTTARSVAEHLRLGPSEVGYSPLPLFHINCIVVGVLSSLVSGASIVIDRRFSRRSFWEVVTAHGVTWLNLVPAIIAMLASSDEQGAQANGAVRLARSASAPLPKAVAERFEARYGIPVIESYGMTETASQITVNPLDAPRLGSVGLPLGLELRVVDADGRELAPGYAGGVQVRGSTVTSAYWSATPDGGWSSKNATTQDGWLVTGDVGWVDTDGYVYLTGREGDVINRGGEKIRPREVEEVLLSDPRVLAAAVVGRPHRTVGEEPVAYVLATEDVTGEGAKERLAADLRGRCVASLSRFKVPAEITVTESLPAGPTGKIRQAEVRQMASRRVAKPHPATVPPRGAGTLVDACLLELPQHDKKPRKRGLTMVIDNGMSHRTLADTVETASPYIDFVKLGWGTAMVTPGLEAKLSMLREHGIDYYFGGTLFEKFVSQGRFESFLNLCRLCDCRVIEISNGTIDLTNAEKAAFIRECAGEFTVLSEVGFKDPGRSADLSAGEWAEAIGEDLDAGASYVITEARESGKSGICNLDGTPRWEVVETILGSGYDPGRLIFESPTKELQTHFITRVGTNVNLGNIAWSDVIGLETLRLGLRSDTLLHFEGLNTASR